MARLKVVPREEGAGRTAGAGGVGLPCHAGLAGALARRATVKLSRATSTAVCEVYSSGTTVNGTINTFMCVHSTIVVPHPRRSGTHGHFYGTAMIVSYSNTFMHDRP